MKHLADVGHSQNMAGDDNAGHETGDRGRVGRRRLRWTGAVVICLALAVAVVIEMRPSVSPPAEGPPPDLGPECSSIPVSISAETSNTAELAPPGVLFYDLEYADLDFDGPNISVVVSRDGDVIVAGGANRYLRAKLATATLEGLRTCLASRVFQGLNSGYAAMAAPDVDGRRKFCAASASHTLGAGPASPVPKRVSVNNIFRVSMRPDTTTACPLGRPPTLCYR